MNLRQMAGLSLALTLGIAWTANAQSIGRVGVIGGADAVILKAVVDLQCQAQPGHYLVLYSTPIVPSADHLSHDDPSGAASDILHRSAGGSIVPSGLACAGVKILDDATIHEAIGDTHDTSDDSAPPEAVWDKLQGIFPSAAGFMSLSLPGYTPSGKEAVVYMSVRCGPQCGKGEYVYLRPIYRRWVVVKRVVAWTL